MLWRRCILARRNNITVKNSVCGGKMFLVGSRLIWLTESWFIHVGDPIQVGWSVECFSFSSWAIFMKNAPHPLGCLFYWHSQVMSCNFSIIWFFTGFLVVIVDYSRQVVNIHNHVQLCRSQCLNLCPVVMAAWLFQLTDGTFTFKKSPYSWLSFSRPQHLPRLFGSPRPLLWRNVSLGNMHLLVETRHITLY